MPPDSERRLAAILFTDLVDSTALMAQSEEAALRVKQRHRELVREQVEQLRGEFIEAPGDETLSIFRSARDAVDCALAIEAATFEEEFRLHIAIHSSDVLVAGSEVHGDGVNIAARLLPFSPGGGICISEDAYQAVRNQPDIEVARVGAPALKNVGRPIVILSLRRADSTRPAAPRPSLRSSLLPRGRASGSGARWPVASALGSLAVVALGLAWWGLEAGGPETLGIAPREIRSLAVLPLQNLSNDAEQEYFTAGMTEALISDLAKLASFDVVSRTSVLQYRDASKPVPEIARELGVDAVIEGSVLRAGETVRITVQLIDARSDRNLWSQSYERKLGDVLALQRQVAESIAREIRLELAPAESRPRKAARRVDPAAYEAYLKGRFLLRKISRGSHARAVDYFEEAVRIDPDYAPAWAGLSEGYT
jgi:TolB-like protein/class 3 adenylate cyclase